MRAGERWNTRLIYLLAALATTSQGMLELAFPLNLHHIGYPLAVVGTTFAALGVGQILSRLPAGHWYRPASAPWLNAAFLAGHGLTCLGLALTPLLLLQVGLGALHGAAFGLVTTFQLAMLIDSRQSEGSMAGTIAWYTAAGSLGYAVGAPLGAAAIGSFGYPGAFAAACGVALLAAALSLSVVPSARAVAQVPAVGGAARAGLLRSLLGLPVGIWLAALLALYINFLADSVGSFFPIYAVGAGIALGFVGLLRSVSSLTGTGVRLGAAAIFRVASAGSVNHACVLAMAAATVGLSLLTGPLPLLVCFALFGLCRGLIRVTSATFVADARSRLGDRVGLASAVYNSGLDAGTVLAPPVTGVLAGLAGIPVAFRLVGVGLPLVYYAIWFASRAAASRQPVLSTRSAK